MTRVPILISQFPSGSHIPVTVLAVGLAYQAPRTFRNRSSILEPRRPVPGPLHAGLPAGRACLPDCWWKSGPRLSRSPPRSTAPLITLELRVPRTDRPESLLPHPFFLQCARFPRKPSLSFRFRSPEVQRSPRLCSPPPRRTIARPVAPTWPQLFLRTARWSPSASLAPGPEPPASLASAEVSGFALRPAPVPSSRRNRGDHFKARVGSRRSHASRPPVSPLGLGLSSSSRSRIGCSFLGALFPDHSRSIPCLVFIMFIGTGMCQLLVLLFICHLPSRIN